MILLMRSASRLLLLVLLLFGGLATVLFVFPLISLARRDATMQTWSRWLVSACGVQVRLKSTYRSGDLNSQTYGHMLVANHISWLDIFVINSVAPTCFIAKADIAAWPLAGTLVGRVGTLFLERGKRHAVHDMILKVEVALRQGRRIAVFPEGTTSDGAQLLPFHGNLIEAAVKANCSVVPVGLRYLDQHGRSASRTGGPANFVGEVTFLQSVMRIVEAPQIIAEITPLPDVQVTEQVDAKRRQAIAKAARSELSRVLGLRLEDRLPEIVRDLRGGSR